MSPKIPHHHPIRISFPISKVEKVWSGAREGGTNPNPNPYEQSTASNGHVICKIYI